MKPNLMRPDLLEFPAYLPSEPGTAIDCRLHMNELPLSPLERDDMALNRYPSVGLERSLIQRLAFSFKVEASKLLATRGSDEGLDLLMRLFLCPNKDSILQCPPTFSMYAFFAQLQQAKILHCPLNEADNFELNLQDIVAAWQRNCKLIMLCRPNNPTGNLISLESIAALCGRYKDQSMIVVDEAYIEFSDAISATSLLAYYDNLIVLRTLSKGYGLAGLRIGAIIANQPIIQALQRTRAPFAFSTAVLQLGIQSLEQPDSMGPQIEAIKLSRNALSLQLQQFPLIEKTYESAANFILVKTSQAKAIADHLAHQGIAIRAFGDPLGQHLRITVGNEQQNQRLLAALASFKSLGPPEEVRHVEHPKPWGLNIRKEVRRVERSETSLEAREIPRCTQDDGARVLFIDRDGTLVAEPYDCQVDALSKINFMPGVVPALLSLIKAGFRLVMVSNQDGLGTASFPLEDFQQSHDFILRLLGSQGIDFDAVLICPHSEEDACACRKPKTALLDAYLENNPINKHNSWVIGDRDSDALLAKALGLPFLPISQSQGWALISQRILHANRKAQCKRITKETAIHASIVLDSTRSAQIHTPIDFFSHMLEQVAHHGGFYLELDAQGDVCVDEHHLIEDTALVLGQALKEALGEKRGIGRYGFMLPMDEALATVAIDLSGRPFCVFEGHFTREFVGGMATEMVEHFFQSFAYSLGAAIHIKVEGKNHHHMIEACFKGLGRALLQSMTRVGSNCLPSTKGVL